MTRGGRFMTLDWFPAYTKSVVPVDETVLGQVTGHHDGYPGVYHGRSVTVYVDEHWLIEDKLVSNETHTYRLHWLLPDWEWEVEDQEQRVVVNLESPQGRVVLVLSAEPQFADFHSLVSIVRAGELVYGKRKVQPFEGWFSPTYGEKYPALSLVLETPELSNVRILSEFTFPK